MGKKILGSALSLIILFSALTLIAQDQKADAILNNVSKTYKSYKSIKAKFVISLVNKQSNTKITQNGTLYLKGKKFRIDMDDQEIYCDGNKMWTYFREENEVQIAKFDPSEQDINPSEIFTIYQKGFSSKYMGEALDEGKKVELIELVPDDKSKPYFKVKVDVDKASHKITKMSVLNKNGITATYKITSFFGNVAISDGFFKFDESSKPGVVKIDLTK